MDESGKFCEHGISLEFGCPTCRVADYPRLKDQLASLEQQARELAEKLEAPGIIDVKHIERIRALETALGSLLELVPVWTSGDFPPTCGDCGTPNASCDMDCATAASMAEHNVTVLRAAKLLKPVEESGKEPSRD